MGALYGSEDPEVCKTCHNASRSHFNKKNKANYKFNWKEALKKEETYHRRTVRKKPDAL